jgi:rhodanese-related sulfurtransferase
MSKKLILLLVIILSIALFACTGGDGANDMDNTDNTENTNTNNTENTNDTETEEYINTLPENMGMELRKNADKLKELIDNGETAGEGMYVLVDVRPANMYDEGHIPTAISLPGGDVSAMENPPAMEKYIIVYCASDEGANAGAQALLDAGYEYVLDWGLTSDWTYELKASE